MFELKKRIAILIGKLIQLIIRSRPSGGTAAPGLIALKIDPQLLIKLKKNLSFSIIISGTNGKTTTARMMAAILKSANLPYFHNRTGSNLLRGIVSTLIRNCSLSGYLEKRIGLWEIDEAVLPEAINQLQPKIVVLTNLFRDQLDRYGEIDTLANKWKKALKKLALDSIVILNADDPTVACLGKKLKCKVIYYGIKDKSLGSKNLSHASDATLCPHCLLPLDYEVCFVSHLGIYCCPGCGPIQPKLDISCLKAKLGSNKTEVKIKIKGKEKEILVKVNLSGAYNIYNILASYITASVLKVPQSNIIQGYQSFSPAFGRFEEIKVGNKNLKILLVKNPTGFNEVLKTLVQLTKGKKVSLLIVLNDLIADGRDVSWIWDVDFNHLNQIQIDKLFVSGIRSYDMALRLKHSRLSNLGKENKKMMVVNNLKKAINSLINQSSKNLYILPTYTAMLETRKILNQKGLVHSTWKD